MTDTALPRSGMPGALPASAPDLAPVPFSKPSSTRGHRPPAVICAVAIAALALFAQVAAAQSTKYGYAPARPTTFRAVTFTAHAGCGHRRPCRYVWYDDGRDGPRGKQRKLAIGKRVRIVFGRAGTRAIRLKVYNRRGRLKAQRLRKIKVRNAPKASAPPTTNPAVAAPAPPAAPTAFACTSVVPSAAALAGAISAAVAGQVLCLPDGSYGNLTISGSKAGMVVVAAQHPGAATLSSVTIGGSNVGVANFNITGGGTGVHVNNGAQHILISHNRITRVGTGIEAASTDPNVGNSPCPTCQAYPPFVDVTIDGNIIDSPGTDAIYVGNFNGLTVTNNEITGVVENGDHSDCLQSTFGGKNITFQGNYEHDNLCQGFFLKDGDVTGARFIDNLFIRGQGSGDMTNVTNTYGLVVEHNTIWDNKGFALRHQGTGAAGDAVVDHNVIDSFAELDGGGWSLSEDYDLFGASSGFTTGPHTTHSSSPPFTNPAAGDYRLSDGSGRGVTWAVGAKHFGP